VKAHRYYTGSQNPEGIKVLGKNIADIEEGLLFVITRIEQMTRVLPECLLDGECARMDECDVLAEEVRRQVKILTRRLAASNMSGQLPGGLVRFPLRLEQIADELASILTCCRIKSRSGLVFSEPAHAVLGQIFDILLDMMTHFRSVEAVPDDTAAQYIATQGGKVTRILQESGSGHWLRQESDLCSSDEGLLFQDMLESLKSANEYIQKTAGSILGTRTASGAADNGTSRLD
jgi:Na+/phosphate symporter